MTRGGVLAFAFLAGACAPADETACLRLHAATCQRALDCGQFRSASECMLRAKAQERCAVATVVADPEPCITAQAARTCAEPGEPPAECAGVFGFGL